MSQSLMPCPLPQGWRGLFQGLVQSLEVNLSPVGTAPRSLGPLELWAQALPGFLTQRYRETNTQSLVNLFLSGCQNPCSCPAVTVESEPPFFSPPLSTREETFLVVQWLRLRIPVRE